MIFRRGNKSISSASSTATLAILRWSRPSVETSPEPAPATIPAHWRTVRFNVGFRGQRYFFEIGQDAVRMRADGDVTVQVGDEAVALQSGEWTELNT